MNKKQMRNEKRRLAAIRRDRLKIFIVMLIPTMMAWKIGMNGGGQDGSIYYHSIKVTPRQKSYIAMQIGRIDKARDDIVRNVISLDAFKNVGKNFYATADEKLQLIAERIVAELPEEEDHFQQMVVLTYVLYCALYDYAALENDKRTELKKLVNLLGTLSNYLLPEDSTLIEPFNIVYWSTREDLQQTKDFTDGGRIEWLPSELEKKRNAA